MADPFTAEIRAFGFNYAPRDWATCDGQIVPISQNSALYALLGVTYGGNGQTNFQLPNLQGSTAVDAGNGPGLTPRDVGDQIGSATVALYQSTTPAHSHTMVAEVVTLAAQAQLAPVATSYLARNFGEQIYSATLGSPAQMDPRMITPTGGTQAHPNMQPYLVMNFCICLYGEWPPHP